MYLYKGKQTPEKSKELQWEEPVETLKKGKSGMFVK
jgi:hypothetical protein